MTGDLITSGANPFFRRVRELATGRRRKGETSLYCEGVQPVWRALEAGADIEALVVAPALVDEASPAARLLDRAVDAGHRVVRVSSELFGRLSDRDGPSGIAAVVRRAECSLEELPIGEDSVVVVLHEVANPGNLGSILRTADAAGAAGVVLSGATADPFSPAAVKASMGSLFNVAIARVPEIDDVFDWAAGAGVTAVTTSEDAARSYDAVDYPRPLALVFGSEGEGLAPEVLGRGSLAVRIPMVGGASSLNLSVAVGVMLFEVQRGRLEARGGAAPEL
ncbi:MAG TPA: RNA methyltransferase [Acidimicrobiales bacterium]|nr:RNA methyltransferase [Acidimicrobiales bacterium]